VGQPKFLRELRRRAKQNNLAVLRIEQRRTSHYWITFTDGQREYGVTVSCSPTNRDHAINNVMADVRRLQAGAFA
jgi:hypothetical protein